MFVSCYPFKSSNIKTLSSHAFKDDTYGQLSAASLGKKYTTVSHTALTDSITYVPVCFNIQAEQCRHIRMATSVFAHWTSAPRRVNPPKQTTFPL